MSQQSVPTSASPEVVIEEVHGNLQVKGWEESEVRANSDSGEAVSLQAQEDAVHLSCHCDLSVRVPYGASVKIHQVHGDARVKLVDQLTVGEVHGSLFLRNTAEASMDSVNGNLQAREISGDLQAGQVMGNAVIRDVRGDFAVDQVGGNLDLRDVDGTAVAAAEGNLRVRLSSLTPGNYRLTAGGNLTCRIPDDASVKLELSSSAQAIHLDLPGQKTTLRQEHHELVLEEGEAEMELSAGGILFVTAREAGWTSAGAGDWAGFEGFGEEFSGLSEEFTERLGQQIREQVQEQMSRLNEQMGRLSELLSKAGFSEEEAERVMRSARQTTEEAATRAQEKIARAQERIARKMEAAARKTEQRAQAAERRHGPRGNAAAFSWPGAPKPPGAPFSPGEGVEPVSEEERLMVLRMLEQKKITLEEAEKLLAALEGKGG